MNTPNDILWGAGLNGVEENAIKACCRDFIRLENHAGGLDELNRRAAVDPQREALAVIVPFRAWRVDPEAVRNFDAAPKILIMNGSHTLEDMEAILEEDFLAVAPSPDSNDPAWRERILEAVDRAVESRRLSRDIYNMTQEILLERELLARKNDYLAFLNRFLSRTSQSLDPVSVLMAAREELDGLIRVNMLEAVFWRVSDENLLEAEFFLSANLAEEAAEAWRELLMEKAALAAGRAVDAYQTTPYPERLLRAAPVDLRPEPGKTIVLPLKAGDEGFGLLALHADEAYNLGRELVEILHTAASHLSLALANALAFRSVKKQADFDGLTRIHNRRHFEERLAEEVMRHRRIRGNLSLLIVDVDHFKQVNDTHGHQAGDAVLAQLGRIITDAVRTTDYAARYGGEEFVILLPHTDVDQAGILAERLRASIEAEGFSHGETHIQATASIGLATMVPDGVDAGEELLREADAALYRAKETGRNRVVNARKLSRATA